MVIFWKDVYNKYKLAGAAPNTYIFDHETYDNLKEAFKHADLKFQLIPPHNHHNNVA